MKEQKYDEVIEKGILNNFIPYDTPVLATYAHDVNKYELSKGWQTEERTVWVIGEDELLYVTELRMSEHVEWIKKRVLYKYMLPSGFHKSRLIRWEATQLSLF